jgi:signal transduction histidine kinase
MKNIIGYFNTDFLKYPVEQKFLLLIPWVASILTGLSAIEGILLLHDRFFVIADSLSTLIFVVAYFQLRIRKSVNTTAWIMVLNTLALSNVVWFRFEGSKGAAIIMILVILFSIAIFFRNAGKILALILVLVNLFVLFSIEYSYPDLIRPYDDPVRRMIDLFVTCSVCGIFIMFAVQGILQSYLQEKKKSEKVDMLKSAFLTNVSHEIRTPLNAIIGFSSLIAQPGCKGNDRQAYARFVTESCNNLVNLVDKIMDISKIESKELTVHPVNCNITELAVAVCQSMKDMPEHDPGKTVDLHINTTSLNSNLYLETDPELLKQVLVNLLDNALKFTYQGYVELGYFRRASDILFYVKDTGIGIADEDHFTIFDSFSKVYHKTDKLYRGLGLGLALTKKILELMRGHIWVNSAENQGSTFYFTLPFNPVNTLG